MTDAASANIAYEDLPEGDWYIEARSGNTVARLLFGLERLPLNSFNMGRPRVVVLTLRPAWVGSEFPDQGSALRIDGRPTFVDEVPDEIAQPIVEALVGEGLNAAQNALAELLEVEEP